MKIYYFTHLDEVSLDEIQGLLSAFPEERRIKFAQCKTNNRKAQSAVAYLLAVYGLSKEARRLQMPEFTHKGKPEFYGEPNIRFNLSHCEKGVAVVVDRVAVGIDIETVRAFDRKLAEYVCNAEELQSVLSAQDPALAFTKLWTQKESWLKLYGAGIGRPLKTISEGFDAVDFYTICGDGWVLTACKEREGTTSPQESIR